MKIKEKINKILNYINNKFMFYELSNNNSGMGVVEIVLIILVLIGLVVLFKTKITGVVNILFNKITSKVNAF